MASKRKWFICKVCLEKTGKGLTTKTRYCRTCEKEIPSDENHIGRWTQEEQVGEKEKRREEKIKVLNAVIPTPKDEKVFEFIGKTDDVEPSRSYWQRIKDIFS